MENTPPPMETEAIRPLVFLPRPSRREVWDCRSLWLAAFAALLLGHALDYRSVVMTCTSPSGMHLLLMFTAFALLVPWSLRHARLRHWVFSWRRPVTSGVFVVTTLLLPFGMSMLLSGVASFIVIFSAQGFGVYPYQR